MNSIEWTRVLSAAVEAEPSCERVQDFEDAGILSSADGLLFAQKAEMNSKSWWCKRGMHHATKPAAKCGG